MTIRAHIGQRFFSDLIEVFIADHHEGRHRLLHMEGDGWRWEEWQDDGVAEADNRPTVSLPYDSGRALLEALTRHYNGAEDTRQLRQDYMAERKRVDQQAMVIAEIARELAKR